MHLDSCNKTINEFELSHHQDFITLKIVILSWPTAWGILHFLDVDKS